MRPRLRKRARLQCRALPLVKEEGRQSPRPDHPTTRHHPHKAANVTSNTGTVKIMPTRT